MDEDTPPFGLSLSKPFDKLRTGSFDKLRENGDSRHQGPHVLIFTSKFSRTQPQSVLGCIPFQSQAFVGLAQVADVDKVAVGV